MKAQKAGSDDGLDEGLEASAFWEPFTDSTYQFGERWDTLKKLAPTHAVTTYSSTPVQLTNWNTAARPVRMVVLPRRTNRINEFASGYTHSFIWRTASQGLFGNAGKRSDGSSFGRLRLRPPG